MTIGDELKGRHEVDAAGGRGGLLYPMLVIAAIAVIVLSLTGIATMLGWLPSALSGRDPAPGFEQTAPRSETNDYRPSPPRVSEAAPASGGEQSAPPASAGKGERAFLH